MVLNLLIESFCILIALSYSFDSLIDDAVVLEDPLPNILSAVGALAHSQQTLMDALLAERVPTYSGLTSHDQVHADRALQTLNIFEILSENLMGFGERFELSLFGFRFWNFWILVKPGAE